MKNLKIFPKMFIQIFSVLALVVLLVHFLVFLIFPKTYLEKRKNEVRTIADQMAESLDGKDMAEVEEIIDLYSRSSEVKAHIIEAMADDAIKIEGNVMIDMNSDTNSLIVEERAIKLDDGEDLFLQFISTADVKKEAKDLSLKFLPYTLLLSFLLSVVVSLVYAKVIKNNVTEIKNVTDKMMALDKEAILKVDTKDEIGDLKEQINDLYTTLLKSIDDLGDKNKEIIKLERLKYDFLKGSSHELKTPLASMKIILENMKYNIGKYKDRDTYIDECIDIVDGLTANVSQILSVSSLENLKNDEEVVIVNDVLADVLKKYSVMASQKNIKIKNNLTDEKIYIGKTALKIILSNLVSNAVKYTDENGIISIGAKDNSLYIENSASNLETLDVDKLFDINFDLNKENSNGLGLYIVKNLLDNYKIDYQVKKEDGRFVFMIKLA
ncbi:HAMP domain-containing sensor histidine kinase [uncultured Ezakiella sp.]|uniref:sensor histidine kinase n=1 Tax=uncultured Ezakiella sp. TaxID=1637529 RepID=UPI0025F21F74|nr:HAMP domain-containing sensor histidine kinase [uncultured Ezakiella sp.]